MMVLVVNGIGWRLRPPTSGVESLREVGSGGFAWTFLSSQNSSLDYQNHHFCRFLISSPIKKL